VTEGPIGPIDRSPRIVSDEDDVCSLDGDVGSCADGDPDVGLGEDSDGRPNS